MKKMDQNNSGKKGIRISVDANPRDTDAKNVYACSECFKQVKYSDRFCWYCGTMLAPQAVGADNNGGLDYVAGRRQAYIDDPDTEYEEEDE